MVRLHDEKNIDSIFFYAINEDLNHLGFWYIANNKKYKFDYKDSNFKESVDRIKYVYNILKDTKNINLIGELTKDIINGKIEIEEEKTYNKTILDTSKYDFDSMKDYIELIITNTIKAMDIEFEFYDSDFINDTKSYIVHKNGNGYMEFYNSEKRFYVDDKRKDYYPEAQLLGYITLAPGTSLTVPITFTKSDKGYLLQYSIKDKYLGYQDFKCDFYCYDKSINGEIKSKDYTGVATFDRLNVDNSLIFKRNGNIVHYYNSDNDLQDEDINKITNVFNMIGFNEEINGIKTMDNNYILYSDSKDKDYRIKLNINDKLIRINFKQSNKYIQDNMDFKYEDELYDFIILKLDDNHIVIQQKYLLDDNVTSLHKKNINRSRYFVITTEDKIEKLSSVNKIIKKEEIETNINTIEDIKTFVKRG